MTTSKIRGRSGYILSGPKGKRRWRKTDADGGLTINPVAQSFADHTRDLTGPHPSLASAMQAHLTAGVTKQLPGNYGPSALRRAFPALGFPTEMRDPMLHALRTGEIEERLAAHIARRSALTTRAITAAHDQMMNLAVNGLTEHAPHLDPQQLLSGLGKLSLDATTADANGAYLVNHRGVELGIMTALGVPVVESSTRLNQRVDPVEHVVGHEYVHFYSHALNAARHGQGGLNFDDTDYGGLAPILHAPTMGLLRGLTRDLTARNAMEGPAGHPLTRLPDFKRLLYITDTANVGLKTHGTRTLDALENPATFETLAFEAPTVLSEYGLYHPEVLHSLDESFGTGLVAAVNDLWGSDAVPEGDPHHRAELRARIEHAREEARNGGRPARQASPVALRIAGGVSDRNTRHPIKKLPKPRPEQSRSREAQANVVNPYLIEAQPTSRDRAPNAGETRAEVVTTPHGVYYVKYDEDRADNEVASTVLAQHLGVPVLPSAYWREAGQPLASATRMVRGKHILQDGLDELADDLTISALPNTPGAWRALQALGVTDRDLYARQIGALAGLEIVTGNEDGALRAHGNIGNILLVNGVPHGLDFARTQNHPLLDQDPEYPYDPTPYYEDFMMSHTHALSRHPDQRAFMAGLQQVMRANKTAPHLKLARELAALRGGDDHTLYRG